VSGGYDKGSIRNPGNLSVAEIRLFVAANTGGSRLAVAGRHRQVEFALASRAQKVASNASSGALYVEIRAIAPGPPPAILVGNGRTLGTQTNQTIDLGLQPVFQQVLLPGESLWVASLVAQTVLMVSEVMV